MKKKLLALLLASVMVVSLAGCTGGNKPSNDPGKVETPGKTDNTGKNDGKKEIDLNNMKYAESPAAAALVSAGKIPAVDKRMPATKDIFVEQLDANGNALKIGTYGGVLNFGSGSGSWDLSRPMLETIIHYNSDGSYYPNVIKSYEYSSDYKVWTFHLRPGMKWSDGEDFNADDITFWYYMCHINNYDSKASWKALREGNREDGDFAVLKKVDDYTVTWTFKEPKYPADFIENGDFKFCWAPSHYLQDLIPSSKYVANEYWKDTGLSDDEVLANALKKNISYATIKDLGKNALYNFWNISGLPTLNAWVLTTKPGNSSRTDSLCILERNNYFWKVDAEGNQLPYFDEIHFNAVSAEGQDQLMLRSGEIDVLNVAMADISSILNDMGTKGTLREFSGTNWGAYQVTFNYTCNDANYANLFANIKFRQAMSICLDREEFSEILTSGFMEPGQCAPAAGNFGYDEDWETKWTEYDVASAKQLLADCGLVMGSDGYYDFADGSDLVLEILRYTDAVSADAYTLLEKAYKSVGIKCASKEIEVGAYDQEIDNNTWYAVFGPHTAIGGLSLKSRVAPFVPVSQAAEWYGDYGTYVETSGARGVEPTGDFAKLLEIYDKWKSTPDPKLRDQYSLEIYDVHKANMWTIAYLKGEGNYYIINSKIQNYPNNLVWEDLYMYMNLTHPWTMYKEK